MSLEQDAKARALVAKQKALDKYKSELPHLYSHKFFWWSRKFWESTNRYTFLVASNQSGKDLAAETMIPTPNGFKPLKNIRIGDYVFARDGSPCKVIDIPWDKVNDTYKVHFNDGSSVVCGPNHEWISKSPYDRFKAKNDFKVYETKEIIEAGGLDPNPQKRFSIPVCKPTQYDEHYLFDPYLIGLLIGDGSISNGHGDITSADQEIIDYLVEKYKARRGCGKYFWRITSLEPIIRYYGLDKKSEDKSIPFQYLQGSIEQRLAILQGLMDTDGYAEKTKGDAHFYTVSPKLRDNVIQLVNSLGGMAWYRTKKAGYKKDDVYIQCKDCFDITISLDMPLFRLNRKQERIRFNTRYQHERVIVKIEPWLKCRTICLSVDSVDESFLCTKNYIVTHNSSCQIRKAIRYCTDVESWPNWFTRTPQYGFYFYPSFRLATREYHNKWVKEFLPRGSMKDDAKYGWTPEFKDKEIYCIHFNSGMKIYFMSYTQKVSDLQAASPDFVCADEEMPMHLWGEVSARLLATKGPFSLVCTPTIGDDFWRGVFENNKMPNACVIKATMYDTVKFEDGSLGLRTTKEIEDYKAKLPTRQQIEVRVYAKFAKAESAVFPTFDRYVHCVPPLDEAKTWPTYAGIDIGSGGGNDPAAIAFVAVRPDMREARVIKTWRGSNQVQTSSIDILRKYQELKQGFNIVATFYDQSSREFYLNAQEAGEVVLPSDKKHHTGQGLMNTLFKHGMMLIEKDPDPLAVSSDGFPFWETLSEEIECMKDSIKKDKQPDDQCDSVRYATTRINFDFSHIGTKTVVAKQENKTDWNDRSNHFTENLKANDVMDSVDREIEFYNEFSDL